MPTNDDSGSVLYRVLCRLGYHNWTRGDTYSKMGRHVGYRACEWCGTSEVTWKGPIFPGRAEDPEAAVRYIEERTEREPPEEGGVAWR